MSDTTEQSNSIQTELTLSAWGSALAQLAASSGLAEDVLADAAQKGAVWCKRVKAHKLRRLRDLEAPASLGDVLYLNYNASVLAQVALDPTLIADDVNYSIWNKPPGMLSQGSKWSDHCTITESVKRVHEKPTYLVHRLDKAAGGLIVVAHTKNALKKLTELFAQRLVEKHYQVEVHGEVKDKLPLRIDAEVQSKKAITDVLEATYQKDLNTSSLLVSIDTGRKHQIRDHLHSKGFPVVGDRLFDADRKHEKDLCLTACRLAFECPFTQVKKVFEIMDKPAVT